MKRMIGMVLVLGAALGMAGCQVDSVRADVASGPPLRGHWDADDYYYYPATRIYFHIVTGHYWYHDHGHWRRVYRLPPGLVVHQRERVHLRIHDKEPWRHHLEHERRYRDRRDWRQVDRPVHRDGDRHHRDDRRELRRDARPDQGHDRRQDRRDDRREARGDKRGEHRDHRDDRREARRDRRDDRWDTRQDRHGR